MRSLFFLSALWLTCAIASAADDVKRADSSAGWVRSLVEIDVTRKQYDYFQPWSKRMRSGHKTGVVIGDREILTTADELFERTLIRLQKGGRGKWWIGEVAWIDYYINLAIV